MADDIQTPDEDDINLTTAFTDASKASHAETQSDPPASPEPVSDPPVETQEYVETSTDTPDPQISAVAEQARALGVQFSDTATDAEIAQAALQQLHNQQPYVSFAQQLAPRADQIRQFLTADEPAPQPKQTQQPADSGGFDLEAYFQEKYGGPVWNGEYKQAIDAGLVQRDPETGLWTPAPGQEILAASLVQGMNAAQRHSNQVWQDIAHGNPYEKFYGVLKDPIMHEVERRVEEILANRERQTAEISALDAFERQHASWLYSVDPQTGQQIPTEKGAAFIKTLQSLQDSGIEDSATALKFAAQMHGITDGAPAAASTPATPANPATPAANTAKAEQTPPESFLESAKRRAAHSPSASGSQAAADAPQVVTEGDLNTMFVRSFAQQVA